MDEKKESGQNENCSGGGGRDSMAELHRAIDYMTERVYELQKRCYEILEKTFGKDEIRLPININEVARTLGIVLEYKDLNLGGDDDIDQNIAQLCYAFDEGEIIRKIYVDNGLYKDYEGPYSNLQGYAIAYELGKYIVESGACGTHFEMQKEKIERWNVNSIPYSLPRLYARRESFEYEICAIFLLLPLNLFLEEFSVYIEVIKEHPILMDKWIKHLSDRTNIPSYQLINGYQYIKFCAYQYYQEYLNDKVEADEVYLNLFR